ncbi:MULTISPECIES: histidine phosphatase family protein [unclassified Duganella]|uniref:histidine phosphatase family protein n=1 Tax=unclassified Duganella TaxID=2636909 RepID=UPI0006F868F1|nr:MULTISPECIES: histidine phosphatase family protein [unclassified Duganella]KQV54980.1 phosphoglycerate mutase [Duganella sp. Root336D2]KRB93194.1 phosphoglycerate mutase [Duganella sp. Root198D2]
MTRILLIRHGETAWNAVRRLQGHTDIPLSPIGERQAESLARALAAEPLDAIISSDLGRARQTAQAVAAHHPHLPLHSDPGLRERGYGAFEGLLYTEIAERHPVEFAEWQARDVDAVMPAGERLAESFRQFYQRCQDGIARWAERYPEQSILIVAHGGVLECAYRAARGLSIDGPRDFQVKNASINRFTFDKGMLLLDQWGEVAHLSTSLDDIV